MENHLNTLPMSKKNKWTIVPFIVVAALILFVLYFLTLRKSSPPAEPLKAIPVNASLIIKINDFKALFEKITVNNAVWNELRTIPEFERINTQLQFLDSLFKHVPDAEQIMQNPPSFISAHAGGKDRVSLMHVIQLPPRYHEKKILDLISGLVVNAGTMNERKYEGVTIHEVALLNETTVKNFSFAVYKDILMVSFSTILLEDAIRQLTSNESVITLSGFQEAYSLAGKNVIANIFINFQHFPKSLSAMATPEFKAEVRSMKRFAGWAEMDVNLLSDMLLMNGFVTAPDSVSSVAALFLNQSPQRLTADKILPGSVASFFTIGLSDLERYFSDYQIFLQDQGLFAGYHNTLASLNNAYGTDLPRDFMEIMDNEISLAFDPGSRDSSAERVYVLMRIKSTTQAEEKLNSLIKRIAAAESKPLAFYTTRYKLDNELSYTIHYLPVRKFTSKIFGSMFSALDAHYFTIIDNYLVFSSGIESLKYLIHTFVLNKTLQNDLAFQEFKNSLSPRSNLYFYCNLSKAQSVYAPYLMNSINQPWNRFQPVFQKVQVMGFQLYANNKMLYNNFIA